MSDQTDPAPATTTNPPKGRSPSYPGIPLGEAIEKARIIWVQAKQHPMPVAAITGRWGYKSPSTGPASVNYAALKKYGLLEDEGAGKDRRGHLTALAVEILNKSDPSDAIQRAAFTPQIMREFWDRFGRDVPPIDALHWEYVIERGFTDNGLADFVRVYKATVAALPLDTPGSVGGEDGGDDDPGGSEDPPEDRLPPPDPNRRRGQERKPRTGVLTYPIKIKDSDDQIVIELPQDIPAASWDRMLALLDVLRPDFVADDD